MRLRRLPPLLALVLMGGTAPTQSVVQNDDERYEATVLGCQKGSDEVGRPFWFVSLRLRSRSNVPLLLAVDEPKAAATDDAGVRYRVHFDEDLRDVEGDGRVTRWVLPPGGTGDFLLKLSSWGRQRASLGRSLRVELPVADFLKDRNGKLAFGPTHRLILNGLTAEEFAPGEAYDRSDPPQVAVEPFVARIESAIVAPTGDDRGEALVLTVAVTNRLTTTLRLVYPSFHGFALDEHGRTYEWGGLIEGNPYLRGIPMAEFSENSPRFALAPGETRHFTLSMTNGRNAIPSEERLSLYFGLTTLKPSDRGKYRRDRAYRLSFFHLRPTGRSSAPLGQGIED